MTSGTINIVELAITLALTGVLVAIALYDIRQWRIPDALNAALMGLGITSALVLDRMTLQWALLSALITLLIGVVIREAFRRLRGYHGLGLGDVKFAAAAAALVGLESIPYLVFMASIAGLMLVAWARWKGSSEELTTRIWFGPFLGAALLTLWLWPSVRLG